MEWREDSTATGTTPSAVQDLANNEGMFCVDFTAIIVDLVGMLLPAVQFVPFAAFLTHLSLFLLMR